MPRKKRAQRQHQKSGRKLCRTIDLHGQTVAESLEILETEISHCLSGNFRTLDVIHGVGSGRVRDAVLSYLQEAQHSLALGYKPDPFNAGKLTVHFK